ncbi:Homeotic protein spalt-major [Frankliniella fusca]|uniref:Homeotic protein spalt-major n=1 Tax=Frankliniella fusca TaxID=407009 RepID=A0AAE1HQE2_9NEOP|nr:Homeotic protein spalt-major [Frankliniella fusca]
MDGFCKGFPELPLKMSDLFKETVTKSVDPSLRRTDSDGSPVASSGVSSAGSKHSTDPSPVAVLADDKGPFNCDVCKRVLQTKKGLLSHMASHKPSDGRKRSRGVAKGQQKFRKPKDQKKRSDSDNTRPSRSQASESAEKVQLDATLGSRDTSSHCKYDEGNAGPSTFAASELLQMDQNYTEGMQEIFETVVTESIQNVDEFLQEEIQPQSATEESIVLVEEEPRKLFTIVEMKEDPYILPEEEASLAETKVISGVSTLFNIR